MPADTGATLAPHLPAIAAAYDLHIIDHAPAGEDWRLLTDQGPRAALLIRHREARAAFVAGVYAHLNDESWSGAPRLLRTTAGQPLLSLAPKLAVLLTEAPSGRPLPRLGPRGVRGIAGTLAEFHAMTRDFVRGFPQESTSVPLRGPARLREEFAERVADLRAYEVVARHRLQPGPFDRIYIQAAPQLLRSAEAALDHLAGASPALDRWTGVVSLGDFDLSTFTWMPPKPGEKGHLCIRSLAPAVIDTGVRDLARLLLLSGEVTAWQEGLALAALDAYSRKLPLSLADRAALLAWLTFPYEAWRLTDRYYRRQEGSSERLFTASLETALARESDRRSYVAAVSRLMEATSE